MFLLHLNLINFGPNFQIFIQIISENITTNYYCVTNSSCKFYSYYYFVLLGTLTNLI